MMIGRTDIAAAGTRSAGSRRERDEYGHLTPRLVEFAVLAPDDPRRRMLRNELAAAFWPVVVHIARRYRSLGEPVEDLEQVGAIGLLGALDRFDAEHGSDFMSFAVPTITGEVRRHFRDRSWALRVPRRLKELQAPILQATGALTGILGRAPKPSEIADYLDVGVETVVEALSAHNAYTVSSLDVLVNKDRGVDTTLGDLIGVVDAALDTAQYRDGLRRALALLPERDRTIVVLRFFGDLTQSQIAAQVRLSQMHVSRVLNRTLATLRAQIADDGDASEAPTRVEPTPPDGT